MRRRFLAVIVISIVIHLLVGAYFGGVVLFEMLTPPEPVLKAPPVPQGIVPQKREYELKLKKSQQQSSSPLPAPIVANIASDLSLDNLDLNIQNPRSDVRIRGAGEGSGIGDGFGDGFSDGTGFDLKLTDFGYESFVTGTLTGRLFDTKFNKRQKLLVEEAYTLTDDLTPQLGNYTKSITYDFTGGSWNPRKLEKKYYRAEKLLYASYWVIPNQSASIAPDSFSAKGQISPKAILAHYNGTFIPSESGKFRFVGRADDVLIVKVGSRIVLDGSRSPGYTKIDQSKYDEGPAFFGIKTNSYCGRWMTWKEGISLDIDILIGEAPGGLFGAYLLYQKKGEDRLRIFSTKPLTAQEKTRLGELHPDARKLL